MILAVETSCDDSAAALLSAEGVVLAQEVFTQPSQSEAWFRRSHHAFT
jgi:tRNA A37 threonylcarbamoyltransferase TsaD